jgi:hypothetical protein
MALVHSERIFEPKTPAVTRVQAGDAEAGGIRNPGRVAESPLPLYLATSNAPAREPSA